MLLLSAVGAVISVGSRTETLIAANFRSGAEALYAAEGALAAATSDLAAVPDWSLVSAGAAASGFVDGPPEGPRRLPGGDVVTLCCGSGSLTDDVQQKGLGGRGWGADSPVWRPFSWGAVSRWLAPGRIDSALYVAVWVADDPHDGDGNPSVDANGILALHVQALGPRGGRRVIEALVARQPVGEGGVAVPGVRVLSWSEVRW